MTPEKKEQNKNHILSNIDKYILDSRGNFYSLDLEIDNDKRYFIGKEAVNDYEELEEFVAKKNIINDKSKWGIKYSEWIIWEIVEVILQEKDQWEITYLTFSDDDRLENGYKHSSGTELKTAYFDFSQNYILLGELGWREHIWKDYETKITRKVCWEDLEANKRKRKEKRGKAKQARNGNNNTGQNNSPLSPQPIPAPTPPNNNSQREQEEAKQRQEKEARKQELIQQKQWISQQITMALNQEPPLANSELSANYHNWAEQMELMNNLNQLNDLKERILIDIQAKKKDKQLASEIKDDLTKVQTGTPEEKNQAWENLEKNEGQKAHEEQKETITKLKVEKATENLVRYGEQVVQKLVKKIQENEVKEEDLSVETRTQYKKLKKGAVKDPIQLVEIENKVTKNIYQVKVDKEIKTLIEETGQALRLNEKAQMEQIKKKLLEFLANTNIYYSDSDKEEVSKLLAKLENFSNSQTLTNSPAGFPWKVALPIAGVLLLAGIGFFAIRQKIIGKRKIKNKKAK